MLLCMIPKIIHHIWFEDGPMTSTFLQCRKAWEQMHPDWEHHPWTGWRLPYRINKHLLQSHGFGSLAEEVLRFALLEEFGGFVVFPSFTCIHSLDHLCVSATALLIGTLDMTGRADLRFFVGSAAKKWRLRRSRSFFQRTGQPPK